MKKLLAWARHLFAATLQGIVMRTMALRDWLRDRLYMSVLRSIAERVGAGLSTAAMIGLLVDPARSAWAAGALGIAGGLFYFAARKPKGDTQ